MASWLDSLEEECRGIQIKQKIWEGLEFNATNQYIDFNTCVKIDFECDLTLMEVIGSVVIKA